MSIQNLKKEIPFKWRIGNFNKDKTKASCLAYIDARDVMNLLDEEIGPGLWKDKYYMAGDRLMCELSIKVGEEWVGKTDTGTEGNIEETKSLVSDAFKRAAVKWGIGRFLYDMDSPWVKIDKYKKPIDDNGNIIWDLTKHLTKPKQNSSYDDAVGIFESPDDIPGKCAYCGAVGKYHAPDCPNK